LETEWKGHRRQWFYTVQEQDVEAAREKKFGCRHADLWGRGSYRSKGELPTPTRIHRHKEEDDLEYTRNNCRGR
jgi:hypothetical protein